MRVVVVSDGGFHGDGLLGNFHDLSDLVFRNFHFLSQYAGIWLKTKFLQVLTTDAVHFVDGLNHVNWNSNGSGLVCNGASDCLPDPPCGVS